MHRILRVLMGRTVRWSNLYHPVVFWLLFSAGSWVGGAFATEFFGSELGSLESSARASSLNVNSRCSDGTIEDVSISMVNWTRFPLQVCRTLKNKVDIYQRLSDLQKESIALCCGVIGFQTEFAVRHIFSTSGWRQRRKRLQRSLRLLVVSSHGCSWGSIGRSFIPGQFSWGRWIQIDINSV